MAAQHGPGSARFGNFINYYSFNPAERRINLLPRDLLDRLCITGRQDVITILDIGCNAGELSLALYEHIRDVDSNSQIQLLGVDLDPTLIQRSRERNSQEDNVTFEVANLMLESHRSDVVEKWLGKRNAAKFRLVSCFSVTLWIHLNHGDEGLKDFLTYISSICEYLIIEPQPWKCYKTAKRRMKKLKCDSFELYDKILWRENVEQNILDYLIDICGGTLLETFGETEWDRKVCLIKCCHLTREVQTN